MSTPRKNFNYMSPYAKPMQQYPSQSGDYISLNVGGQFQAEDNGRGSGSLHYPNASSRQKRQNFNFRNSISYSNNSSAQKKWDTPRKTDCTNRNNSHCREKHHQQVSISSYLHSSMTEDPWKEFLDRIDAINNSKITLRFDEDKDNGSNFTESDIEDPTTQV